MGLRTCCTQHIGGAFCIKNMKEGTKTKTMEDCALEYLDMGFSVIPLRKENSVKDRTPYFSQSEFSERLPTKDEIKMWWKKWPHANIGIMTGKISNVVVIDIDNHKDTGQIGEIIELEKEFGKLPDTAISKT